jgi:hypothetical protein
MEEVKKMIRAVINGQSSLKQELLGEIKKTNSEVTILKKQITEGFKKVNDRSDNQGNSLAYLEDDVPTRE